MNSLEELNSYSSEIVTFTDQRPAQVDFDPVNAVNQSITINENNTHLLPVGIDIVGIVNFDSTAIEYVIDFSSVVDPVAISYNSIPTGITVVESPTNVFTISVINSPAVWDLIKSPTIQLPFQLTGSVAYTATINYTISSTVFSKSWNVDVTINEINYISTVPSETFLANVSDTFTLPEIIVDTAVFDPLWTLEITPSNINPIELVTPLVSPGGTGTFNFNPTTKVTTISGNKAEVNTYLSNLQLTFGNINSNFNWTFSLTNDLSAQVETVVVVFENFEIIINDLVSAFSILASGIENVEVAAANLTANTTISVSPLKIKNASSTMSSSISLTSDLTAGILGRMVFEYQADVDNSNTIEIPFGIVSGDPAINAEVDWGDGSSNTFTTASWKSHTYSTSGNYTVTIRGTLSRFSPTGLVDTPTNSFSNIKILGWSHFGNGLGLKIVQPVTISKVSYVPDYIPPSLEKINVFGNAVFNDPAVVNWDTSNLTDTEFMFSGARIFNQPIGNWDTSSVTNMKGMFERVGSSVFNQPIGNWDTSSVTNMDRMFNNTTNFNQDLSGWCVTNIVSEPTNFATGSALTAGNKPVWGTCP